jgi:CHAT domain-containing protein
VRFALPRAALAIAVLCLVAADAAPRADVGAASEQAAELERRGRFGAALEAWRGVERALAADAGPGARIDALLRIAAAEQELGQYRDAVATLETALAAAGAADEPPDAARLAAIHGALGNARIALGPPDAARSHLERGVALARESGAGALAAALLVDLGNLSASRGDPDGALRSYDEAEALARGSDAPGVRARALANAARMALLAERPPHEVRTRLDEAGALARALPASHATSYLWIHLGRSWTRLASGLAPGRGDLARAHEALVEAERIAAELGDDLAASWATGHRGELYTARGRFEEALALTRRARFLAQEAAAPEALYAWDRQLGRILRAQGDVEGALAAYRQAVRELQGIRFELAHGYAAGEASFHEAVAPVFSELVDLLLASAPDPADEAAHQARLREAREIVELLKEAELRDYLRDECVDAARSRLERVEAVSPSAAIVYPVPLPDRLELLVSLPDRVWRAVVPVGAAELTARTRELRRLLEKRTTREYLPPAQRLYDWLVRPLEPVLAAHAIDTLVLVPDAALRAIPLAALHDGASFLGERWAVATTPALRLTDPRPLDREGLAVFASGLSQAAEGFPALEHVPGELAAIHALWGGSLLLDADFQVERVARTLAEREFDVVHIASHGQFSSDAGSSYLVTADGRLGMERLGELVGVARFRERPIELLTLSACETAEGDERAALGLAGVAVQAGARSVLGTLWSVSDAAASELVVEFYRQLRAGPISKAVALQRAQQRIRESPDWAHPFYWSPFVLISNWL